MYNMFVLLLCIAIANAATYTVTFSSLGPQGGAPGNIFCVRLENTDGTMSEMSFLLTTDDGNLNCLADDDNIPCTYTVDTTDIGDDLAILYVGTQGSNALLVDEIVVESSTQSWTVDDFGYTAFQYDYRNVYPSGCEVLVVDLDGDDIKTITETPKCTTFPFAATSSTTNKPNTGTDTDTCQCLSYPDYNDTLFINGGCRYCVGSCANNLCTCYNEETCDRIDAMVQDIVQAAMTTVTIISIVCVLLVVGCIGFCCWRSNKNNESTQAPAPVNQQPMVGTSGQPVRVVYVQQPPGTAGEGQPFMNQNQNQQMTQMI